MKHLSYQQLEQAAQFSRYWTYEMKRQREILRELDATYLSDQVISVWLQLRRETLETLGMHESQLKNVQAEMKRRRSLVGWL